MRETLLSNMGGISQILAIGIVFIILFIVLRFFKTIFSFSFIGLMGSVCSYFIYDYIYKGFPIIGCLSFICCVIGFNKDSIITKMFSLIGILLSGYVILHTFGLF